MIKGKGMSVDRLDYAIRDLLTINQIYQPEYSSILNNIFVNADGVITCKNINTARLIFNKFLTANREIYFNPKNEAASLAVATILQHMLRQGLLIEEDFFLTEDLLIAKILESPYKDIFQNINPQMEFSVSNKKTKHLVVLRKLRYVNPIIQGMPGYLTDHCEESKKHLDAYLKTPTRIYYEIPILGNLH